MNREAFQKAVEFAAKAVGSGMPVLECVLIESDGQRGTVMGSNLDIYCRHEFECDVPMHVVVRAQRLKAVLDAIPDDEMTVCVTDTEIHFRAGTSNFKIPLFIEIDHFPKWRDATGQPFEIPCDALDRILPFAHKDKASGIKNSVWLDKGHVVACDGRRMGSVKADVTGRCLLPIPAAKLLSGLPGTMRIGGGNFGAAGDGWEMTGKLMEGEPIAWQKMIPQTHRQYPIPASFEKVLARAVKLYVDQDKTFNFRFSLKDGVFECQDYSDKTDMDGEIDIFANADDFLEAINSCPGDATVKIGEDAHPVVITSGDFTAVCTRVRQMVPGTVEAK